MTKPDFLRYDPWPPDQTLLKALERSTLITRTIIGNLSKDQETVSISPNVNPPHWEFGHLIWFQEFWVHRHGLESNPSLLSDSDVLFNSSGIIHDDRWQVQLPSIDVLLHYFSEVTERSYAMLRTGSLTPEQAYFLQLALFHQDMHNEAFAYTWQHLGYVWPVAEKPEVSLLQEDKLRPTYIDMPLSQIQLGSAPHSGFIFDNEKWQHEVTVPPFSISSHAVSNGQYLEFLEAQSNSGLSSFLSPPLHWRREGGQWYERSFHQWLAMDLQAPVRHISAQDAEQYCLWRGLRLPTESELTALMLSSPVHWRHSKLWEWTSSTFIPFEGFSSDPYQDYSNPWYDGSYRVLKGWSPYTPEYLRRPQFRNFYLPSRSDPFCGFRTCLA
jgi:gamma-glutamyl hercynylcysteine S-oxide synthase